MSDRAFRFIILVVDLVVLAVSATLFYKFYDYTSPATVSMLSRWNITLALMGACFLVVSMILPPKCHRRMIDTETVVNNSVVTTILFVLLVAVGTALVSPTQHFPRRYLVGYLILFGVLLSIERLTIRKILMLYRRSSGNSVAAVFIGHETQLDDLKQLLSNPDWGYRIKKTFQTPDEFYEWQKDEDHLTNEVYVNLPREKSEEVRDLFRYCDNHAIRCFYVPSYGFLRGKMEFSQIEHIPLITRRKEPLTNPINKFIKRTFDLVFSTLAILLVYWWVYIICAIIIKIQSPGPVYFKQARTGLNGNDFMMLKFRSMKVNNDADKVQATKDDPRKYPFGNFMRKTNIDELPQLVNIWRGDMSIVGPRPHMLKHTDEYSALINKYMVRHLAKPGLTGLAQVSGFRGETKELADMEGRVRKDIEYVENWSILLDMKIIGKTFLNMITGDKQAY